MRLAIIVPFLNEAEHLERVIASMLDQTRPATVIALVDDGSDDASHSIARRFAAQHENVLYLQRPRRPSTADRLAEAAEYRAFLWALDTLGPGFDVVAKLDADIVLTPATFETVLAEMERDESLGIAGTWTAELAAGRWLREAHPELHVRGGTKYYRRRCIDPLNEVPPILGWDTIDDLTARAKGWRTRSLAVPTGDPQHLRKTGEHDGRLRGYRRWGRCAWGYGASLPFAVVAGIGRMKQRPRVIAGIHFVAGYVSGALSQAPRAEPPIRRQARGEGRARLLRMAARAARPRTRATDPADAGRELVSSGSPPR